MTQLRHCLTLALPAGERDLRCPSAVARALRGAPAHAGLLRFITAGSVDDGKSTLIGRLLYDSKGLLADQVTALEAASRRRGLAAIDLSLLTDGLLAEREQGITIDVAYRYFATPARKFIIGDSPGHAQYTRNMVTAASTADVAVLLVDARHGLQQQTRRHAYLARWVGIPRVVLAVNKMDLVDGSREAFEAIRAQFHRFATGLGFTEVREIPLSALRGDMVVERGDALSWYDGPDAARVSGDRADAARRRRRRPGLASRCAFRCSAWCAWPAATRSPAPSFEQREFRGYQGTRRIRAGSRVGDEVLALPAGTRARVAEILTADGPLDEAATDMAVTVRLDTRDRPLARRRAGGAGGRAAPVAGHRGRGLLVRRRAAGGRRGRT